MGKQSWYIAYGLLLRSEIPVLGASPVSRLWDVSDTIAEVTIEFGVVNSADEAEVLGPFRRFGDAIVFECAGVARFRCEGGRRIIVQPLPGASEKEIGDILVATALPTLLWMRPREIVLHAAGVILPGERGAIAVCGVSGGGKSTVLRALLERGAGIIGDDTVRVTFDGAVPLVSGLPARYCWDETPGPQRVSHAVALEQIVTVAPLRALFMLQMPRLTSGFRLARLQGADAINAVLEQRHRPLVPRLLKRAGADLPLMADLARLQVCTWQRGEYPLFLYDDEFAALHDSDNFTIPKEEAFA